MQNKIFITSLSVLFFVFVNTAKGQTESPVDKKLFEITRVGHLKTGKKKLSSKDKKLKIKIRSPYDMGNATIVVVLNGKKVEHQIKELGTESAGVKVKIVTGVIYDIIAECKGLLKPGENKVVIKGYGVPQERVFKIRQ
jgi:hypothetical protein